jgi:purine-binding chemotaxis protein CheW
MSEERKKFLGFHIDNELYGVPLSNIREVHRYISITPIHEDSSFLKGVINLRGRIVPIIDMRLKFGMKEKPYTDRTIFIILDVIGTNGMPYAIGIAVDGVSDVVDLSEDEIETTGKMGLRLRGDYLYGIAQVKEQMMMLLNIGKLLTTDEVIGIKEISENIDSETIDKSNEEKISVENGNNANEVSVSNAQTEAV